MIPSSSSSAPEREPQFDLFKDFEDLMAEAESGVVDGEVSLAPPPPKRPRLALEVPECCVCMEVAAPLVVYDCDHAACGPCTRNLERPRPLRSAGFSCPQCRATVRSYTVPLFIRQAALEAASETQRRLADNFLDEYRRASVRVTQAERVNRPGVDAAINRFLARVPRTLAQWYARDATFETSIAWQQSLGRVVDRRSFRRRLGRRLGAGSMRIAAVTQQNITLTIHIEHVAHFDNMRW